MFRNLSVHGNSAVRDYQKTVGSYPLGLIDIVRGNNRQRSERVDILGNLESLAKAGEILALLELPLAQAASPFSRYRLVRLMDSSWKKADISTTKV